ncbi:hypothetical protein NDU88_006637 [Pleurodeles waltl]|uniref:Uncharacterized protein n=1 Tax=Pleurodeles waltl TaxID=8319 RepID=A0AAV7VQ71_PLEWA|nr:hypothetical protein NDU88_006637 [Pleurodeles waltl]
MARGFPPPIEASAQRWQLPCGPAALQAGKARSITTCPICTQQAATQQQLPAGPHIFPEREIPACLSHLEHAHSPHRAGQGFRNGLATNACCGVAYLSLCCTKKDARGETASSYPTLPHITFIAESKDS